MHMEAVEILLQSITTVALNGGERSSCPGHLTSREEPPLKGGPQSWPENNTEEVNLLSLPGIKPQIIQHVA